MHERHGAGRGTNRGATTPTCAAPSTAPPRRPWASRAAACCRTRRRAAFSWWIAAFGWQDADYTETLTLCTKLCEDEIVHGGEELLARTILRGARAARAGHVRAHRLRPGDRRRRHRRPCARTCARRCAFRSCPIHAPAFAATRTRARTSPWRPCSRHLVPDGGDAARCRARSV